MKSYAYSGFDQRGKAVRGLVEAEDTRAAREALIARGVIPEHLEDAAQGRSRGASATSRAFSLSRRAVIYRELGALVEGGMEIERALDLLVQASDLQAARPILAGIRNRVHEGQSLSHILEELLEGRGAFEAAMIQAGESAGDLAPSLLRLSDYLDETRDIREKIQTALMYPVVVLLMSILALGVLLLVMLPNIRQLLVDLNQPLPLITKGVLAVGQGMTWALPLLLVGAVVGGLWIRRQWRGGPNSQRPGIEGFLLRMPLLGAMLVDLLCVRFSRTLALLLKGGLPLPEAVALAGKSSGWQKLTLSAEAQAEAIRHGGGLSDAVGRMAPIGGPLTSWVRAGEASGSLPKMLDQAAAGFQRAWDRRVARFLGLIEPVIILGVGVFVLLVALAVLLPLLSINRGLG